MAVEEHAGNDTPVGRVLTGVRDKRLLVLARIQETGSISEAARSAGVSYTAAWQAVSSLTNLAGTPVVEKAVGGVGGGGTRLTPVGLRILKAAEALSAARRRILAEAMDPDNPFVTLAGGALRTSVRNHLVCEVVSVVVGKALVSVTMRIGEAGELRSKISKASAQLLEIAPGRRVQALFKAAQCDVAADFPREFGHALLRGRVLRIERGEDLGGEIELELPGGLLVAGLARPRHGLKVGDAAVVRVPSSAVIIAVEA